MSEEDRPGARVWVWFRLRDMPDRPALGLYLGNQRIRLLRARRRLQREFLLDVATHWAPFDTRELEEAERRAV